MLSHPFAHQVIPETPLGPITMVASPLGIQSLHFGILEMPRGTEDATLEPSTNDHLDEAAGFLAVFFQGNSVNIQGLRIDWSRHSAFSRQVLSALCQVPWGKQTTYGALAARVGRPRGARAVGQAVGANPIPVLIPCHRVLPASGHIGGFSGGVDRKRILLALEGWVEREL
jgi:methylated-DNA-[protein]-cysteine S-methyltransferase